MGVIAPLISFSFHFYCSMAIIES